MKVVGLTGGIASGKSTVTKLFSEVGADVIDADAVSKELTAPGGAAVEDIRKEFGDEVIDGQGGLDRMKMREIVFVDKDKLRKLESILHPLVFKTIFERVADYSEKGAKGVILDIPLLIESNFPMPLDAIIVVTCDLKVRINRVKARDGFDEEEVRRVMANQMTDKEKIKHADYVIENDGDLETTRDKVLQVWTELTSD